MTEQPLNTAARDLGLQVAFVDHNEHPARRFSTGVARVPKDAGEAASWRKAVRRWPPGRSGGRLAGLAGDLMMDGSFGSRTAGLCADYVRFVTLDLALRTDGVWRVIELGDGQVSDCPPALVPELVGQ